ncbi:MAG: Asp-tRNA(Asn)/Glu-tRNA(Gln) amidotransferase subunit GatC [Vicinamibacterales bacterium]
MPPRITRDEAARIAALAKLDMADHELDRAARELESILGYFDVIARVDTTGTEPAATMAGPPPLRADAPLPSLAPADTFANAPDADTAAGLFRVPRVLGS